MLRPEGIDRKQPLVGVAHQMSWDAVARYGVRASLRRKFGRTDGVQSRKILKSGFAIRQSRIIMTIGYASCTLLTAPIVIARPMGSFLESEPCEKQKPLRLLSCWW